MSAYKFLMFLWGIYIERIFKNSLQNKEDFHDRVKVEKSSFISFIRCTGYILIGRLECIILTVMKTILTIRRNAL